MKFIDECHIVIEAGNGGNGIVSFRREAKISHGGPDGGDGGNGGNIYFRGTTSLNTLLKFKYQRKVAGKNGQNGMSKNRHGKNGEDVVVDVPIGTVIWHDNFIIGDIVNEDLILIAKGGDGGFGNTHFKSSRNVAPRLSENGSIGQKLNLKLELRLLGDIALIGLPSAGKSSLINNLTNAKSKVGDFDFTTINPILGRVKNKKFTIVDLPGIIFGASKGKGLGFEFLKHINRCKAIANVIDFGSENKNPIQDFKMIQTELFDYNHEFQNKESFIIANKSDLPNYKSNLEQFKKEFSNLKIIEFSNLNPVNLLKVVNYCEEIAQKSTDKGIEIKTKREITISFKEPLIVKKLFNGLFDVSGEEIEKIYHKIPLNTFENTQRFYYKLKEIGLWKKLHELNIKNGDQVQIFSYQFVWSDTIL